MRIIELGGAKPKKSKNRKKAVVAILIIIFAGGWLQKANAPAPNGQVESFNKSTETAQSTSTVAAENLKIFSDPEFKLLYKQTAYPNIQDVTTPPSITGNAEADKRIHKIATERGYALTSVPVAPIHKVETYFSGKDDLLQLPALNAWQDLKTRAEKDKIPLTLVSAYRSFDFQRALMLDRLKDANVKTEAIQSGRYDSAINEVLIGVAPPGFSRHHTGYIIDLACGNIGLHGFIKTACFDWISKNNYEIAKLYGWIPSYPEGAKAQGPEPEPWEYAWVGVEALIKR